RMTLVLRISNITSTSVRKLSGHFKMSRRGESSLMKRQNGECRNGSNRKVLGKSSPRLQKKRNKSFLRLRGNGKGRTHFRSLGLKLKSVQHFHHDLHQFLGNECRRIIDPFLSLRDQALHLVHELLSVGLVAHRAPETKLHAALSQFCRREREIEVVGHFEIEG